MYAPRFVSSLILVSALGLAGCSDSNGPTPPTGPSIAGNWSGTWRSTQLLMTLQQSGSDVSGSMTLQGVTYDLTGTIDEFGIFRFSARDQDPNSCRSFSSSIDHIAVTGQGSEMDGRSSRRTPGGSGNDPCGGRTLVEQGSLEADKV